MPRRQALQAARLRSGSRRPRARSTASSLPGSPMAIPGSDPMFEAYIDSKYYWIPGHRVARISLAAAEPICAIWSGCRRSSPGPMGANPPASCRCATRDDGAPTDSGLRLARKTEWVEKGEGLYFGLGQRSFSTDDREYSFLEMRKSPSRARGSGGASHQVAEAEPLRRSRRAKHGPRMPALRADRASAAVPVRSLDRRVAGQPAGEPRLSASSRLRATAKGCCAIWSGC